MNKKYTIYKVEGWQKKVFDDDNVTTVLSPNIGWSGYNGDDRGIAGNLEVYAPDSESPDGNEYFLVTIEKLPKPAKPISDGPYQELIDKRRAEDSGAKALPAGRKFR